MMLFDIIAVLIALAILAAGRVTYKVVRRKMLTKTAEGRVKLLQAKGAKNLEEIHTNERLVCEVCNDPINPDVDVFINFIWFHRQCYKTKVYR